MRRPRTPKGRTPPGASFMSPTAGWISNQNLSAAPAGPGAYLLRNWFPGPETTKLRRGSVLYTDIETVEDEVVPAKRLMTYALGNNEKLFACTDEAIYDVSLITDPEDPQEPSVEGLTSADWSYTQFSTVGGTYLLAVNGEDPMQVYDGSQWWVFDGEGINRLNYDTESAGFSVGEVVTGGSSLATATIVKLVDNGTSGILYLGNITGGPFTNNETLTGSMTGSALADGVNSVIFPALTGVDTADLISVWAYNQRLFFAQKNSLTAWYLPVDQIAGAATALPLGGVFEKGGGLLFGSSWSGSTSGQGGLSEQCAFVTTEGEVAVYQGTNPSSGTAWGKVGLYQMGKPLGKRAHFRVGGDVVTATDIGLVGLSMAMNRDIAALAPGALSFNIDPDWRAAVQDRAGLDWSCLVWTLGQMVIVALPPKAGHPATWFVANALTGGWAEFTGWDAYDVAVHKGRLFFAAMGRVVEAWVSGMDEGATYSGSVIPLFDPMRAPASRKIASMARVTLREPRTSVPEVTIQFDFDEELPIASPASESSLEGDGGVWGVSTWGGANWSSAVAPLTVKAQWVSVNGSGYRMAPSLTLASGSLVPLDTELIGWDVIFDIAEVVS